MSAIRGKPLMRLGKWLPEDSEALGAWLRDFTAKASARAARRHPVIEEFADLMPRIRSCACT
jgi:hypothetical protein